MTTTNHTPLSRNKAPLHRSGDVDQEVRSDRLLGAVSRKTWKHGIQEDTQCPLIHKGRCQKQRCPNGQSSRYDGGQATYGRLFLVTSSTTTWFICEDITPARIRRASGSQPSARSGCNRHAVTSMWPLLTI